MSQTYRVIKGSVGHADVVFRNGSVIPEDALNEKQIKSLLSEGVIAAEVASPADQKPPTDQKPPADQKKPADQKPPADQKKPWSLDPKKISVLDLDELHVLIAEIDPKRAPPEDSAGCIALLSRDFKPK